MRVIVILVLLVQVFGRWDNPIKVVPYSSYTVSIFTDSSNGVSHLMWCNTPTGYFSYRRLYPNGTVTPEVSLNWERPCKPEHKLNGLHDGETLYLLFQGTRKRTKDLTRCQENPDNCEEVYFAESADGGNKWIPPIPVSRKDMNDRKSRQYGKLLIGKNNRLWIFYWTTNDIDSPCGFIMRTPGSSIFSTEIILPINITRISVVHSEDEGKSIVSIYYSNSELKKNYRYYTASNGVNWIGPEEINYCGVSAESMYVFPFSSVPSVIFVGCRDAKSNHWLQKSSDVGKTWERINTNSDIIFANFAFANDEKGEDIFGYGTSTVYYMRLKDKELKEMGYPPTPSNERCIALTTSYKIKSFWFWYEVKHIGSSSVSLWVTRGDMENVGIDYSS